MDAEFVSALDQERRTDDDLRALRGTLPEPADRSSWWRALTTLTQKWTEFSREAPFRESLADLRDCLGDDLEPLFQRVALLTLKQEALAGRRARSILDFLAAHSFRVVHCTEVTYTPLVSREIWRYSWNVATLDRLLLRDLVSAQGPALMLTLEDLTADPLVPASVRLLGLKGSPIREVRSDRTLRSICQAPNRILSMVHTADEPADIIREFGLLYSGGDRREWARTVVERLLDGHEESCDAALERLHRHYPHADFELAPAQERIRDQLAAHGAARSRADAAARAEIVDASGDSFGFRDWYAAARSIRSLIAPWDLITVASHTIKGNIPMGVYTLDEDGRPEWFAGHGDMLWKGKR